MPWTNALLERDFHQQIMDGSLTQIDSTVKVVLLRLTVGEAKIETCNYINGRLSVFLPLDDIIR